MIQSTPITTPLVRSGDNVGVYHQMLWGSIPGIEPSATSLMALRLRRRPAQRPFQTSVAEYLPLSKEGNMCFLVEVGESNLWLHAPLVSDEAAWLDADLG